MSTITQALANETAEQLRRYVAAVRAKPIDGAKVLELARAIGVTPAEVDRHLQVIAEVARLRPIAALLEGRRKLAASTPRLSPKQVHDDADASAKAAERVAELVRGYLYLFPDEADPLQGLQVLDRLVPDSVGAELLSIDPGGLYGTDPDDELGDAWSAGFGRFGFTQVSGSPRSPVAAALGRFGFVPIGGRFYGRSIIAAALVCRAVLRDRRRVELRSRVVTITPEMERFERHYEAKGCDGHDRLVQTWLRDFQFNPDVLPRVIRYRYGDGSYKPVGVATAIKEHRKINADVSDELAALDREAADDNRRVHLD